MNREFKQPISSNPDPRPAADPDGWVSEPRFWVWREVNWRAGLAANTLATLFAVATLCWFASAWWPASFEARPFLMNHFFLVPQNLDAGRFYCHLTYAFVSVAPPPITLLTFAGLVLFGYAAERRVGAIWLLAIFLAATVAGGAAGLFAGSPAGHELADRFATGVGGVLGGDAGELASRFSSRMVHMGIPITGPAAAVAAFIAVAVLVRPSDDKGWDNVYVAIAAAVYLAATGWLVVREVGPGVNVAARFTGLLIGVLAAVGRIVTSRDSVSKPRKPWRQRLSAVVRLGLPLIALFVGNPAPGFSETDFRFTCFWLERVASPILSEPTKTVEPAHHEHEAAIRTEVGEVTSRTVRWDLTPSHVSPHQIEFAALHLVNVGSVTPVAVREGNEFAQLAAIRRKLGHNRADVAVLLLLDGHDTLRVPLSGHEDLEFAKGLLPLTEQTRVPVTATVEKIDFTLPKKDDAVSQVAKCEFRIHLTGLKPHRP